jgi:O-antigen/teichoic acid export membrane protein
LAKENYNIFKNLFFSTVTTFSSLFLYVLFIWVGRTFGLEDSGLFNTALFISTIFEMFVDFGLRDLTVRNLSRNTELTSRYISNLLSWKLFLSLVVYIVMLVIVNLLYNDAPDLRFAIYILTISAFLKSFKYTFRAFFQANNLFNYDSFLVILERTSVLIVGLFLIIYFKSLKIFIIGFTIVRFLDFIILLIILNYKIAKINLKCDFKFIIRLQKEALPFGMFFVILSIYSYVDGIMLERIFHNLIEAGLYSASFRIYEGLTILPTIFFLVFLPRLSELYISDQAKHADLAKRSIKYMFIMAIPVIVFGFFFAKFLLIFFYSGKIEFVQAERALQILFFGILFQYPNWMLNSTLMSMDKQKIIMYVGIFALIFKVIFNLFIIPLYGYEGAAVATVCGEAMIFFLNSIYLRFHHLKIPVQKICFRPIVIGGIIASGFYFGLPYIPLIPLGMILGVIYLSLLFLLKIFDTDEIVGFRNNLLGIIKSK